LLEFANLQMAAEAYLVQGSQTAPDPNRVSALLVEGNTHASKFTQVQAEQFVMQFKVLAQYRNDPLLEIGTGFSATLFEDLKTHKRTLSFRSTEFRDDEVRDSKATNELELKALGWDFGQIAEMEKWYKEKLLNDMALLGVSR
jgi:hypothetical protein